MHTKKSIFKKHRVPPLPGLHRARGAGDSGPLQLGFTCHRLNVVFFFVGRMLNGESRSEQAKDLSMSLKHFEIPKIP